jgi:nitrite reductase (NO-forming)
MKVLFIQFLLLTLLAIFTGGCTTQPDAVAQTNFDAEFTLTTAMGDGRMVFVGAGGEIDGVTNPDLIVPPGSTVHLTLINADGMPHDLAVPDLGVKTAMTMAKDDTAEVEFEAGAAGSYVYYCTVSGHRQAGMEGRLVVQETQ